MHGQEYVATTWAMAIMNTIIHDMEGMIEIGDTLTNETCRGNVDGIQGLDDGRHRSGCAFHDGSGQSNFCNDAFQPAKLDACIRNIVVVPIMLQPHPIDEAPALYAKKRARVCLRP